LTPLLAADPLIGGLFWAAIAFWLLVEWVFGVRSRPPAAATLKDRGSRIVVVVSVGLGIALAANLAFAVPQAGIAARSRLLPLAGIALIVGGEVFRLYAIRSLGRYFTFVVALHPDQRVVESGPYRLIRHPSYTGSLVTVLGICLAMANWLSFLGMIPAVLGYLYRIRIEECALVEGLGEEYRAYQRRTKRLIPYIV
jgi:protein-S-isoprenylcysteine O-methyltransferase Ste14